MHPKTGRRLAVGTALGLALLGAAGPARGAADAAAPKWVTTSGKVVHLTLIAGWNQENVGFNFDGGAHGKMVVTVPLGDTVDVTFTNNVKGVPHNVEIIPFTTKPIAGRVATPAFKGAETPSPQFRPGQGGQGRAPTFGSSKPLTFSFVADKAGKYMIICAISGHALAGMWDTFVVSSTATTATVAFM